MEHPDGYWYSWICKEGQGTAARLERGSRWRKMHAIQLLLDGPYVLAFAIMGSLVLGPD